MLEEIYEIKAFGKHAALLLVTKSHLWVWLFLYSIVLFVPRNKYF